jgi:hypothetical protein
MKFQHALTVVRLEIPQTDGIIFAAREKLILSWMQRDTGYGGGVALEITNVGVVMGRQISDGV